jgi:hypothetical protein
MNYSRMSISMMFSAAQAAIAFAMTAWRDHFGPYLVSIGVDSHLAENLC